MYELAHDWHKHPAGKAEPRCRKCGCPARGSRGSGIYHRATLLSENSEFADIVRKKAPDGGWVEQGLCKRIDGSSESRAQAQPITQPSATVLRALSQAAMLQVIGKSDTEINEALGLPKGRLHIWQTEWQAQWQMALQQAEQQVLASVRAMVGTVGILENPDQYFELASAAHKIAGVGSELERAW